MLRRRTPHRVTCAPEGPARPQRTGPASPGELGAHSPRAQAQGTSSTGRASLSPRQRLPVARPQTLPVARCTVSSYLVAHTPSAPTPSPSCWLKPAHASPLPLQRRGVRRAKAPDCQGATWLDVRFEAIPGLAQRDRKASAPHSVAAQTTPPQSSAHLLLSAPAAQLR